MNSPQRQSQFNSLISSLHADLYRFAFWLCKNRAQAEDVLQEAFLRAWKSMEELRDVSAAKAWLMTIIRREYLRTFERKQLDLIDLDDLPLSDQQTPALDQQSDNDTLRAAMLRLAPKYRVPLVLQVLGGLSCGEIASELGIGEPAVMTQLFRAREQLKTQLTPAHRSGNNVHVI
jgi:RNA polymerase sigma-70 factor, ECF subfamily